MMKHHLKKPSVHIIDLVPAISGLIGKIALVSSFAFMWAQALDISAPNFVFENVRIEILVGGIITLIMVFIYPNASPPGTLAPLIVLVPTMVSFGVHPFILSIMVGIIGIISIKTKVFEKIVLLSGYISKTSLALIFGVSGVLLSLQNLSSFFGKSYMPFLLLILLITISYVFAFVHKKTWLIIPISTVLSLILPRFFGMKEEFFSPLGPLIASPSYWWNDMWGVGFGFDIITILKTLPFAIFVIVLWAIDTVSIKAIFDANTNDGETQEKLDVNNSFVIASVNNIVGGVFGVSQTSSLWRSFLIPLYIVKRPLRSATILLGVFGIVSSLIGTPIKILSYPPLIWTVLLFGIFIPLIQAGLKNTKKIQNAKQKGAVLLILAVGVIVSPILAWICSIAFEKIAMNINKRKNKKPL